MDLDLIRVDSMYVIVSAPIGVNDDQYVCHWAELRVGHLLENIRTHYNYSTRRNEFFFKIKGVRNV